MDSDPLFPLYTDDYDEEGDFDLYIQAATQLTRSAMESQLLKAGASTEETAENVMLFFEMAFRRIQALAEEDEDDYLDELEENGESQG